MKAILISSDVIHSFTEVHTQHWSVARTCGSDRGHVP